MISLLKRFLGRSASVIDVGQPTEKTGNQWTEDDFSHLNSELATVGGNEFADFCIAEGDCDIAGDVLDKFQEILKRIPTDDEEEYDFLGVVVRQRLISANLLPEGDPERYQYKVAQWGSSLAKHG
ncbi:hypothetical protein [Alienimonas sp. DA493]|uniref:hypothetical protein n=1 Tax=Alienimonas sp. DA493 TaxID=3373605 RepID=UPI003754F84C